MATTTALPKTKEILEVKEVRREASTSGPINAVSGSLWIIGLALGWMAVLYMFNFVGNRLLGR